MSGNHIENSGNNNYFHQNIVGNNDIYSLSVPELAGEYQHNAERESYLKRDRLKGGFFSLGLALLLLATTLLIVNKNPQPNIHPSLTEALQLLPPILAERAVSTMLALIPLTLSGVSTKIGLKKITTPSEDELEIRDTNKLIDKRAIRLGVSKRDWKKMKKNKGK